MEINDAVRLAILNIQKESITDVDVFSRPFEVDYLSNKENQKKIYDIVEGRIKKALNAIKKGKNPFEALKELKVSPLRNLLVPKKNLFDFRKCSYTEPIDEIIYLSLVLIIAPKIEKRRINKKNEIVFSYRLKQKIIEETTPCYLFDNKYSYTPFRSCVSKRAQEFGAKVIVSCDVSNFYDRLNLHRLENTLLSIPNVEKDVVALINELLLFWSNRDSYGLPVGSNASRILAEASLLSVDKYLLEKGIKFIRFVDDYRLFAKDGKEAHSWLSILVDRLNQEGLFLNTSKTKISSYQDIKKEQNNLSPKEDPEMEKTELPLIIRGYSGIIPTKFRQLSEHEITNLKDIDIGAFEKEKIDKDLIDPLDLQKFLRTIVAQKKWDILSKSALYLSKFPQFIPYYLDCVYKNHDNLKDYEKQIKDEVMKLGEDTTLLEYLRIYIFKYLSSNTDNTKYLLNTYLNLKRGEGIYLGRSLLENIFENVNRDDVLEIKKTFQRADSSEKRIILRIMHYKLNKDEFNVFIKNISLTEPDPWIEIIFDEKIKEKTKENLK